MKGVSTAILSIGVLFVSVIMLGAPAFGAGDPCSKTLSSGLADETLCGHGNMIAIIVPSDDPNLENELDSYDASSGLAACTTTNGCLEVARPYGSPNASTSFDVSSYVEQAHETAPGAKILVVEAKSNSWQDMYDASYWVQTLPEVEKTVSVSWSKIVIELGLVLK